MLLIKMETILYHQDMLPIKDDPIPSRHATDKDGDDPIPSRHATDKDGDDPIPSRHATGILYHQTTKQQKPASPYVRE